MYQANIAQGGSLQALSNPAFNFGTGDFTVMAMVESTSGGTAVARKGTSGGSGNGGFLLVVNPDGSIKFATDNGFGYYQVVSGPTSVLDGDCHTVAGIRTGATLSILLDGLPIPATASGNATPPLNVNNNLPLTIGCTQQSQEPHNQFLGAIMNVSVWNAALSGDRIVKAAFARVTGSEPNLQGYWTLDATSDDLSPNDNPASIVGLVTFRYCLDCVWAEAANAYTFCQITNMIDPNAPSMNVTLSREIDVPAGAPALAFAIMADQDVPAFPTGAEVTLSDPSGHVYSQDQNTDTLFAGTSGGQLWGLMAVNPAAGTWKVTVTVPSTTAFHLTLNTVPSADVVATSHAALDPLFSGTHPVAMAQAARAKRSLGGFWSFVAKVAVAAVVGVIVGAGAFALGIVATVPAAIVLGVVAFAAVGIAMAQAAIAEIAETNSLPTGTGQMIGMAGFVVAAGGFLLMDANAQQDEATTRIYRQRQKKLYPNVTASTFNKVQSQIVGADMTKANVGAGMSAFTTGYVTGCGHGQWDHLQGWYDGTNWLTVLVAFGANKFAPAEAQGKIIHLFACNCGYLGTADRPGLGQALVAGGAIAFFGYKNPFIINVAESPLFCSCDIEIDLSMIRGQDCATAYANSIAAYNAGIATLKANGNMNAAAQLEKNRDSLVSPTVNAAFGDATARLQIA